MARIVNGFIGKKNKTWCDNFMLAATLGRVASRLFAPRRVYAAGTACSALILLVSGGFCIAAYVCLLVGARRLRRRTKTFAGYCARISLRPLARSSNRKSVIECSIVRCSIFKRDLSRAIKRQGWERLCGAGQAEFFVPAAGARSARDHGAGFTKTGLARAAFERTARRAPRERAAGQAEGEGRRLT